MSIRMHKYLHRFLVTGMTAIITLSICAGVAAESYTANIMRLLNYEGDVFIVDENGEYSFLMENMRFNNGESLSTSKGSMASVGLDSSKILTLDAMTQVLFETVKNQMKLTLASGRLLLDVQEKLDENAALDIQTSNLTVGIRLIGTGTNVKSNLPQKLRGKLKYIDRKSIGSKKRSRRIGTTSTALKVALSPFIILKK